MRPLRDYPEQIMNRYRNTRLSDIVLCIVSYLSSVFRK